MCRRRSWWGRPTRRGGARECGLDAWKQPGERIDLGRRELHQERSQALTQKLLGGVKGPLTERREGERLAPAIIGYRSPLEQTGFGKA